MLNFLVEAMPDYLASEDSDNQDYEERNFEFDVNSDLNGKPNEFTTESNPTDESFDGENAQLYYDLYV